MARRPKESLEAAFQQLKTMFSGATLRAVADIKERGEVLLAKIGGGTADTHDVHEKKRDIWVTFTDVLTGMTELGRLYAPAGILWRLTPAGQGAHVIRGRKMRGPGGSLVIPDGGDGSTDNVVPNWLSKDLSGISLPEGFEIESTGDQVKIVANSGGTSASIVLNKDGSIEVTPAAGKDLKLNGATHPAPLFDTFETAFAAAWNQLIAVLQAGTQGSPVAQQLTGLPAVLTSLQQFATNLTNGTYNSQHVKNG